MVPYMAVGTAYSTLFLCKILLLSKEDFPQKMHFKAEEQARRSKFAPINL